VSKEHFFATTRVSRSAVCLSLLTSSTLWAQPMASAPARSDGLALASVQVLATVVTPSSLLARQPAPADRSGWLEGMTVALTQRLSGHGQPAVTVAFN
jgi:hypothetical protein